MRILAVIDPQHYFADGAGDLAKRIERYCREQRDACDAVVVTLYLNQPGSRYVRELGWSAMMEGDPSADPAIALPDGAVLITKHTYSAAGAIRERFGRAIAVDLCGFDLDACVLATAFDLWDAGIPFRVLDDLTRCGIPDRRACADLYMRQFGRVLVRALPDPGP